jgi:hypothetical protein
MAAAFDPYQEWLELPARPENYYSLLGLATFESDPNVIAHAADGLRSRVRRIRPGAHMAEWQALLDEVAAAKTCLLDAKAKAAYDAQLRNPTRAKSRPAAAPQPAAPATFQPPPPPPWLQKPAAPAAAPAFQEPPPPPWVQQAAATPAADPGFQPPPPPPWLQTPQAQPYVPAPQGWAPQAPMPADYAAPVPQQAYAPRMPSRRRMSSDRPSLVQQIAGPLIVILFVAAAVGGYVAFRMLRDSDLKVGADPVVEVTPPPAAADKAPANPSAAQAAEKPGVTKPDTTAAVPKPDQPAAQLTTGPGATGADQMAAPPAATGSDPMMAEAPKPATPAPEPAKPAVAATEPAKPATTAEPAKPAADPAKQAELTRALKAARGALGRRNVAEAKRELEKARASTQSPEDEDRVTRYENLTAFITEFWKGIVKRLGVLKPMDEVEMARTRIIVVEASGEEIRFKSGGRVYHYRLEAMPIPFLAGLVEGALNDAPSKLIFGAFLAVEPQGDAARAAELWKQAAEAGEKIDQLLPPLDELIATRDAVGQAGGGAPTGGAPAAGGDKFASELAALQGKAQKASEASEQAAVAKEAIALGQEAFKGGALEQAVKIAQFAGEIAHKAHNTTLGRQATALERRAETALKRKSNQ